MLTKRFKYYRSFLMLVRVGLREGFIIPIPISLIVLDQTFDALEDLVWLLEKLFLRSANFHQRHCQTWMSFAGAPSQALRLCRELINELRCYGRWRMVEVETDKTKHRERVRVYIDFI